MKPYYMIVRFLTFVQEGQRYRVIHAYMIDWNNRKEVAEFAAKANEWLRAAQYNKVETEAW